MLCFFNFDCCHRHRCHRHRHRCHRHSLIVLYYRCHRHRCHRRRCRVVVVERLPSCARAYARACASKTRTKTYTLVTKFHIFQKTCSFPKEMQISIMSTIVKQKSHRPAKQPETKLKHNSNTITRKSELHKSNQIRKNVEKTNQNETKRIKYKNNLKK